MAFGATDEWRTIAKRQDVLYQVLTVPGKEDGWSDADFYATGRSDWQDFARHWRHYDPELGGTCVEIGCGPGRITASMAPAFERVVALDVSDDMIAMARAAAPENVEFNRVDDAQIPLADDEADAAFSVHVFQHLANWTTMSAYLSEVQRVLRPGGTLMIHIWLHSRRLGRLGRARQELALARSRRRLRRGKEPNALRMRIYRPEDVHGLLSTLGFEQIELRMLPVASDDFNYHFWFARSPATAS